ncbi:hypothetical protein HRG_005204 [Hirsutella rhossiliensis]|uniref:Six-bladed beta-propeller-like protein n=1 Tax=Hirsutella rhossiliensis TaxID=111463 RepID=A0A9P8MWY0_9HYPO|nr:uncharacterized protein HRG_05204 [Hirsutella rhossiliensis]KAH0962694.1 hypothetical protein HRG_05204 [Hirsutella rhossiliensis]
MRARLLKAFFASLIPLAWPATLAPRTESRLDRASLPLPHRLVAQFPVGTWIENIAVRPNGNILVTSLAPNASLYEISNPQSESPTVTLHFTISTISSLSGITEVDDDCFCIVGGNFSPSGSDRGAFSVWVVDFKNRHGPEMRRAASLPDAVLPNGATKLPHTENTVLIADSTLGLVWKVHVHTGEHEIALQLPEMSPQAGGNSSALVGINGIHAWKGRLWWTNSANASLYRVRIMPGGNLADDVEVEKVASLPSLIFGRLHPRTWGPRGRMDDH